MRKPIKTTKKIVLQTRLELKMITHRHRVGGYRDVLLPCRGAWPSYRKDESKVWWTILLPTPDTNPLGSGEPKLPGRLRIAVLSHMATTTPCGISSKSSRNPSLKTREQNNT